MSYAETRDAAMRGTLAAIDEAVEGYVEWHGSNDSATWHADERGDGSWNDDDSDGSHGGPGYVPEFASFRQRWFTGMGQEIRPPLREWPVGTTVLGLCHAVLDAADGSIPVLAELTIDNNPGELANWSATAKVPNEHANRALNIRTGPVRLRVAIGEESTTGDVLVSAWECNSGDSHVSLEMRSAGPLERVRADLSIYEAHGVEPPEDVREFAGAPRGTR